MSALQRAADALLTEKGLGGLAEYVESRKARGMSWRGIVRDLERDTDGVVAVTEVTLRAWVGHTRDVA